jgi:leader peptidase (prepilin peptidase)/N-methyltransferase
VISAVVFLFGLAIGSFLNVCIHRLPRGDSIVRPRSRCPHCHEPIAAYDNIPVLSYLWLRGRCRHCRGRISPLYPTVELLTGALFVLVYQKFGISPVGAKTLVLGSLLLVLIFTDLRERLLPDRITYAGVLVGFSFALWVPVGDGTAASLLRLVRQESWPAVLVSLADALLGSLLGAGLLFALGEIWYRLRHVEAMGFGDVKMMAMVGLFFGLKLTLLTLLVGSLCGSLIGGIYILLARKNSQYELPLGTFLGVAGVFVLFWGEPLVAAYLRLLR